MCVACLPATPPATPPENSYPANAYQMASLTPGTVGEPGVRGGKRNDLVST